MTLALHRFNQAPVQDCDTGSFPAERLQEEYNPTYILATVEQDEVVMGPAHLPPVAPDPYSRHDLIEEALFAEQVSDGAEKPEYFAPFLNPYDSRTALEALTHPATAEKISEVYGKAVHEAVVDKTRALTAVTSAAALDNANKAYGQYVRFRQGVKQDEALLTLANNTSTDLDVFSEAPLLQVGEAPLIFSRDEADVVIDALVRMANTPNPTRKGEELAAMDLLYRYTDSELEKKYYRGILERAGVQLDVGNLPIYNEGRDGLLQ